MIMPGLLVCSTFLISVCMFIVSKDLLISRSAVVVQAEGAIWLNPFATVLFNVCSAVTVECGVVYLRCVGVWYVFCYIRKKALSSVLAITKRRDMGLYELPLAVFVGNASPRGPMRFLVPDV